MKVSWKKVAVVGVCAIATGVIACAASPVIGYAVGNALFGWTGCAATSSGLAFLGGGSLASGGCGMAGGVTFITSTGSLAGARVGTEIATLVD